MSEAVAAAPRPARLDLGGWWVLPPLIVLALLFLYPLALIARAALVDDSGAFNFAAALDVLNSRALPPRLSPPYRRSMLTWTGPG